MSAHDRPGEDVLIELKSDLQNGLSAAQVSDLQQKHGPNKLSEKKKKSTFARFLDQFKDVMILILIAAAVVSFTIV